MRKVKAAVLTATNRPFEIQEFELTKPPEGMAKIRLIASGICGTDVHIYKGKIPVNMPAIIGHEFIGEVEALSASDSKRYGIQAGDHVIVDIACPCGHCRLCRAGDDANCVHMGVTNGGDPAIAPHLYGGYAEYNYSPVKNLIKIPSELDPVMVDVFACAGPTVLHAFQLAEKAGCNLREISTAVIQGLGPVGMFALLYLKAMGVPNVIAVTGSRKEERDQYARQLGAAAVLSMADDGQEGILAVIERYNDGLAADLVFESSGNPRAVPQGLGMLRNRGVYLIPGQYSNSGAVEIEPQKITFNALHLIGSSQYAVEDVKAYLQFLQNNPQLYAAIDRLHTDYSVPQINEAFQAVQAGKNIKTLLVPER